MPPPAYYMQVHLMCPAGGGRRSPFLLHCSSLPLLHPRLPSFDFRPLTFDFRSPACYTAQCVFRSREMPLQRICVFAGSYIGANPAYAEAAAGLGRECAARGIEIVYGGGNNGLMGVLADAAVEAGGSVIGVITRALNDKGYGHDGVDLRVTDTMHERKALMADLADAFIALPGGIGTLEELFEALTWSQLGIHAKHCGLLNAAGYYGGLTAFLRHAVAEGFLREKHQALLHVEADPARLLDTLAAAGGDRRGNTRLRD